MLEERPRLVNCSNDDVNIQLGQVLSPTIALKNYFDFLLHVNNIILSLRNVEFHCFLDLDVNVAVVIRWISHRPISISLVTTGLKFGR